MKLFLVALLLLALAAFVDAAEVCTPTRAADGTIARSEKAIYAFRKTHPCPATGKTTGACHGYVIDHRQALCVCGRDAPENMRWMTVAAAAAKDRWECKPGWQRKLAAEATHF